MTLLCVPVLEEDPWPSLGGQVCDWIEANLVFGPGDLRGEPAKLDDEKRALIWRVYEVYPDNHPQAGRRRFKRVCISVRKGWAKTEWGAWLVAAELHPTAPVRFDCWERDHGALVPMGRGVTDCYIPMVAYTEEQSEELAYHALRTILEHSPLRADFDIGLERILRIGGDGKAVALATAPDSRDGARTTFQLFDETHRLSSPRHKMAHRTMMANIPKRRIADAWSLEITTAPAPGEGSVAEDTHDYARQVAEGKISDSRLFYFHRQASDDVVLTKPDGSLDLVAIRAAVLEASGPVATWSDIDGIVDQFADPTADINYLRRVWLNQLVRATERAFDAERWRALAKAVSPVQDGDDITLGFDGSRYHDATALVATHIRTGYQWPLGIWERPYHMLNWEVPEAEVDAAVAVAFQQWAVWRLYADPPYWETTIAKWVGQYGDERVIAWRTNRTRPMVAAIQAFHTAIQSGELSHDGNAHFQRHVGNAVRRYVAELDEQGRPLWWIQKERPDSPHKMDGAMAACLAWEARRDALAAGVIGSDISEHQKRVQRGESLL